MSARCDAGRDRGVAQVALMRCALTIGMAGCGVFWRLETRSAVLSGDLRLDVSGDLEG